MNVTQNIMLFEYKTVTQGVLLFVYFMDEKSDHVFRGCASPPPLRYQSCSSFRIQTFSY